MARQPFQHLNNVLEEFLKEEEWKIEKRYYKEIPKKKQTPANLYLLKKDKNFSKQAVVKLLSNLSARGVYNAINYAITHSEYEYAINELGEQVKLQDVWQDWKQDFSNKKNAKEAWHLCFSIKEEVNPQSIYALQQSVNATLQKHFYAYKYVQILHTHQNNPHIHVILNKNNIFSQKKLHFKDKEGIRNLFNEMREDFADSLNYNGLNYHNAYKFEKENILEKIELTKQRESKNYYRNTIEQIQKDKENLEKKQLNLQTKDSLLKDRISQHKKEKLHLINELQDLIKQQDNYYKFITNKFKTKKNKRASLHNKQEQENTIQYPQDNKQDSTQKIHSESQEIPKKPTKESFNKVIDRIKYLNGTLKLDYSLKRKYKSKLESLKKEINNIGFDYMRHRNNFAKSINEDSQNVLAKQEYLKFVLSHKTYATKEQIFIAQDIQNEIKRNAKEITESIALQNKLDSELLKYLGVKSTSQSLIFAQKDIEKKLNILHSINHHRLDDTRLLDRYKNTLQTNSIVINKIMNDKILGYEKIFRDKEQIDKHHIKTLQYYFNEFKALTSYLDSIIDSKQHRESNLDDFKMLQTKIHNVLEQQENALKQQQINQEQQKYYYDFIEWYIVDRKITMGVEDTRKKLRTHCMNNTLESWVEKWDRNAISDYKIHLIEIEREKQKQKQQSLNSHKESKGMER